MEKHKDVKMRSYAGNLAIVVSAKTITMIEELVNFSAVRIIEKINEMGLTLAK